MTVNPHLQEKPYLAVTDPVTGDYKALDRWDIIKSVLSIYDAYPRLRELKRHTTTQKQRQVLEDVENLFAPIDLGDGKGIDIYSALVSFNKELRTRCKKENIWYEDFKDLPPQNPTPEFIKICQEILQKYPELHNEHYEKALKIALKEIDENASSIKGNSLTAKQKKRNLLLLNKAIRQLVLHQQLEIYPDQTKANAKQTLKLKEFAEGLKSQVHNLVQELEQARLKAESKSVAVATDKDIKAKSGAKPVENKNTEWDISSLPRSTVYFGAIGLGGVNSLVKETVKAPLNMAEGLAKMLDNATKGQNAKGEWHLVVSFFQLMNWVVGGVFTIVSKGLIAIEKEAASPDQRKNLDKFNADAAAKKAFAKVNKKVAPAIENGSSLAQMEALNTRIGSTGTVADPDFTRG